MILLFYIDNDIIEKKCVVFLGDIIDNFFWDFVRDFFKKFLLE